MFKPTDKPKRYLAAAAFAAVLITVPCLGALNTSADQARMEWPAPEHFEISSVYGSRYDHSDFHMGIDISDAEIANSDVVAAADGKVVDVTSEKSDSDWEQYQIFQNQDVIIYDLYPMLYPEGTVPERIAQEVERSYYQTQEEYQAGKIPPERYFNEPLNSRLTQTRYLNYLWEYYHQQLPQLIQKSSDLK